MLLENARDSLHAAGHVEKHADCAALRVRVAVPRFPDLDALGIHLRVDRRFDAAFANGLVVLEGVGAGLGPELGAVEILFVRPTCRSHGASSGKGQLVKPWW